MELPTTHVRLGPGTYCGSPGETISVEHFDDQKAHVASLKICPDCVRRVDGGDDGDESNSAAGR